MNIARLDAAAPDFSQRLTFLELRLLPELWIILRNLRQHLEAVLHFAAGHERLRQQQPRLVFLTVSRVLLQPGLK